MRTITLQVRPALFLFATLLPLAGSGCGNGTVAAPSELAARNALETALKSWVAGEKPGNGDPSIVVQDTPRSQGLALEGFEILGEEPVEGSTAEKRFKVRLSLTKPSRTEEVHYHVLGSAPLMVFRDEDYVRNVNMEDGPKLKKTSKRGTSSPSSRTGTGAK